jgi:hypothetical protein
MRRMRRYPPLFGMVPYCAFVTWKLGLAAYHFPIFNVIAAVVVAGLTVRGHHESLSDPGAAVLIAVLV